MSSGFSNQGMSAGVLLDLQKSFDLKPIILTDRYKAVAWEREVTLAVKSAGLVNWRIMETQLDKRDALVTKLVEEVLAFEERVRSWNSEVAAKDATEAKAVAEKVKERNTRARKSLGASTVVEEKEKDVFWYGEIRDRVEMRAIGLHKFLRDSIKNDIFLSQLTDDVAVGDVGGMWLIICKELYLKHPELTKAAAAANFKSDIFPRQQFISNAFAAERYVKGQSVQEFAVRLLSYKQKYASVGLDLNDGMVGLKFREEMDKVFPMDMAIALTKGSFEEQWRYVDNAVNTRILAFRRALGGGARAGSAGAGTGNDGGDVPKDGASVNAMQRATERATGIKCYRCGKRGHVRRECKTVLDEDDDADNDAGSREQKSKSKNSTATGAKSGKSLMVSSSNFVGTIIRPEMLEVDPLSGYSQNEGMKG